MRVHVDDEAKIGGKIAADLAPAVAGVVAAHHVPMLLHEEHIWPRAVHGDMMNAVAHLSSGVGHHWRHQALVDRLPCLAAIVGSEGSGGGDGDVHALLVGGIDDNGVQTHAARSRLPVRAGTVAAQTGELLQLSPPSADLKSAASSTPA